MTLLLHFLHNVTQCKFQCIIILIRRIRLRTCGLRLLHKLNAKMLYLALPTAVLHPSAQCAQTVEPAVTISSCMACKMKMQRVSVTSMDSLQNTNKYFKTFPSESYRQLPGWFLSLSCILVQYPCSYVIRIHK